MTQLSQFSDSLSYIADAPRRETIILFHGLTTCPAEMKSLAEQLHREGFSVHVPRLPGHGGTVEDLGRVTLEDWCGFVREQIERVPDTVPIFVGGLSLGGLLALYAAAMFSDRVAAAFALAPPFQFRSLLQRMVLKSISVLPDSLLQRAGTVPKQEKLLPEPRPELPEHSIAAGARVAQLQRLVRGLLPGIRCPLLLMQDPDDHHVAPGSAKQVASLVGSDHVELLELPGGRHELLAGPERALVRERIISFFNALSGDRPCLEN